MFSAINRSLPYLSTSHPRLTPTGETLASNWGKGSKFSHRTFVSCNETLLTNEF